MTTHIHRWHRIGQQLDKKNRLHGEFACDCGASGYLDMTNARTCRQCFVLMSRDEAETLPEDTDLCPQCYHQDLERQMIGIHYPPAVAGPAGGLETFAPRSLGICTYSPPWCSSGPDRVMVIT